MKDLLEDSRLFLTLLLSSILVILLDASGLLYFPKLVVQTFIVPVQFGVYEVGKSVLNQAEFLWNSRFAALENKALKLQLSQVISENAVLQKKINEDEALISQPSKLDPQVFDLLPARVVGFSSDLTIDKGAQEGVMVGEVVVYQENYIGEISQVNPRSSKIILPFDPSSKIAVFSQNQQGRAKGILVGQFGSELLMDKILHEEPIEVGDLVYSEGSEGQIPRGLILGKIEQVLENQNQVFKQAEVKPLFDFNDLDVVFVIKGS